MTEVIVSREPLDPTSYQSFETDNPARFIAEYFGTRPDTLRVFDGAICEGRERTFRNRDDVEALAKSEGPVYAIENFGAPGAIAVIAIVASVAVGVAAALLIRPPMPTQRAANFNQPSPNNELSARENVPRIGKRIEDIYGTVRSTPSLLAVAYSRFIANREVEIMYACVGRGSYSISDIRDGDTPISRISGASAEVYGPSTSPNSGLPQLTIGPPINEPVRNVRRNGAVNGQTLQAPNASGVQGLFFGASGNITTQDPSIDAVSFFSNSETVTVSGSPGGVFDGEWTVIGYSQNSISIDPTGWPEEADFGTLQPTAFVSGTSQSVIGPFVVEDADQIWINYVALNGLWRSDGETQTSVNPTISVEFSTIDESGNPIGTPQIINRVIYGSSIEKGTIGVTEVYTPSVAYPMQVSVRRTTPTDKSEGITVQDEVKIRDLYAITDVDQPHFGNVTTILTQTFATSGALAVKERRLNCLARRLVPKRNTDGTFTAPGTDYNVRDVLIAVAKDPHIGARTDAEIDAALIHAQVNESQTYFGSAEAVSFDYTFDDDNMSFEETFSTIAAACFLVPYRIGNVLKVRLDRATDASSMVFTHRNTVPDSMRRSVRFGPLNNYDGVELDYVDPSDDSIRTIFIPSDQSAVNPMRVETVGVRSRNLGYWHASREWNKIRYQNTYVEFEGLEQANLLTRRDRVIVADQTRGDTSDGEVIGVDGLTLTLSQPHEMDPEQDYAIWLMYADQTVQSIDVAPGADPNKVILQSAPSGEIIVSDQSVTRTNYILSSDTDPRFMAFLVEEKSPNGGGTNTVGVTCFNYDSRYYANDGDTAPT